MIHEPTEAIKYTHERHLLCLPAGFEHFINQRANKPAELIAKYIDLVMRGGSKAVGAVGEDEVESTLDRALVLFRYIQVDVFVTPSSVAGVDYLSPGGRLWSFATIFQLLECARQISICAADTRLAGCCGKEECMHGVGNVIFYRLNVLGWKDYHAGTFADCRAKMCLKRSTRRIWPNGCSLAKVPIMMLRKQ